MATTKSKLRSPQYLGKLIFKYITSQLTPAQEKTLIAWRNLSAENDEFFQRETDLEYIRERLKIQEENLTQIGKKLFPDLPEFSKK